MTVATLLSWFSICCLFRYRQPRHLPSDRNFERVGDYLYQSKIWTNKAQVEHGTGGPGFHRLKQPRFISLTCLHYGVMRLLNDTRRYCILQVLRCVSIVLGNSFRFLSWFC